MQKTDDGLNEMNSRSRFQIMECDNEGQKTDIAGRSGNHSAMSIINEDNDRRESVSRSVDDENNENVPENVDNGTSTSKIENTTSHVEDLIEEVIDGVGLPSA
ncbi:hypothetical protein V6N13_046295 [Hibiscus sabdariffa]